MTQAPSVVDGLVQALLGAVDHDVLRAKVAACLGDAPRGDAPSASTAEILKRIVLADILDDSILGARPGDKPFPLRVLLGHLTAHLADDAAFTFATGLNFYFRAALDEEDRARLGVEVSRAYYRFATESGLEAASVREISPLLASLLSGELSRLRLESVDHTSVYDSQAHEREDAADRQSARIARPASFLLRVASNGMVKMKARVHT